MSYRFILFILVIMAFSSFCLTNCAGTQGTETESSPQDSQQEDLDDIEKLLGISSTEETKKTEQKAQPKKQDSGEKLSLLDTEIKQKEGVSTSSSSAYQAAAMAASSDEPAKQSQEVQTLKKQLQKKDDEIANLKAKLVSQDSEIQRLNQQKSSSAIYSGDGGGGPISDISSGEYESRYDEARAAFENRNYEYALQLFESLLGNSTSKSLSDNAQYWIGECHYALRQYDAAIIAFEKVFTFPKSNKKPDAQFKLGLCYARKGDKNKAIEEFNRLKTEYPNSIYVSRAEKIIATL
ncbi:MAG: tetratricopeptide repeat protein [Calditrichaceae bacterium]|nr:tetratricopeptide repeat protein [Calditrichaceae bacterium]RQV96658.1 MAG: hypothetical protein EH224_03660 [Calditrichota bacterium]